MSSAVEEIKSRLSITDVIGSYIKLEKAGTSYKGLCPFHHEKTPSFNVSPSRQAYYCFGCNRGGDIFTFVEEIEGIDFMGALKNLAERAGVTLDTSEFAKGKKDVRDRLYALMEEAALFYERNLGEHEGPLNYLRERGLTDETIAQFGIGYVPPPEVAGWRAVHSYLRDRGYSDSEIEQVGLIKKADPKPGSRSNEIRLYDRFRGRIMFPIRDQNGRVVAFTARIYGKSDKEEAKYINSPETELYDKSTILFGYDMAKTAIRKQNFTVIVEGQMDCIMAHQGGTPNTVAVSGTALTERHLGLLKRLSENVVFAFDADDAGLNATARAFQLALGLGMGVRVANIPDAKDPADLILRDPKEWEEALAQSTHIIDFLLVVLREKYADAREYRDAVEARVVPMVLHIPSKIEQAHFIIEIARRLQVPEEAVWEEVKRKQRAESYVPSFREEVKQTTTRVTPARSPREHAEESLLGLLLWQEGSESPIIDTDKVRVRYQELYVKYDLPQRELAEHEKMEHALRAEHMHEVGPLLKEAAEELLYKLEREVLKDRQAVSWKRK